MYACVLKDVEDTLVVSTRTQSEHCCTVGRDQRHGRQNHTQVTPYCPLSFIISLSSVITAQVSSDDVGILQSHNNSCYCYNSIIIVFFIALGSIDSEGKKSELQM